MSNFRKYLEEASLSRIYQHFNSNRPIGLITAFRGGNDYDKNVESNKELAQAARKAGYGYIWVDGAWIEDDGPNKGQKFSEDSLFIVGPEKDKTGVNKKMFDFLISQAKKYNQDAFVFKEYGSTDVALYDKQGNEIQELKNAKFDKTAEIFTSLRHGNHVGRTFVLEGATEENGFSRALYNKHKKD